MGTPKIQTASGSFLNIKNSMCYSDFRLVSGKTDEIPSRRVNY